MPLNESTYFIYIHNEVPNLNFGKKLDDLEQVYNPAIWEILGKFTFFDENYTKTELLIWGGICNVPGSSKVTECVT